MHSAIYFHSENSRKAMFDLVKNLPSEVEVYLVGGAVRNALINKYHNETWRQRDYDQIVTNGSETYFSYLESTGFSIGTLDRLAQRVMVKPVIEDAKTISYEDNLVLDIHMVDGTSVEDNLRNETGLLINGFALSLRDIFDENWLDKLIQLPSALECIKAKQVRVNLDGYATEANNFFACMRFVGAGFSPPPQEETTKLLVELMKLEHDRYQRNLAKLSDYVGGEAEARRLLAEVLGPEINIFNEASAKAIILAKYVR